MRLALASALAAAACTPDIAPGAYFCGPEQACPEGLACDAPDNTCVLPSLARPFTCNMDGGDDAPSSGTVIRDLECVSGTRSVSGCLSDNDPADWYQFDVPPNCTAVQLEARLRFPLAFQGLGLLFSDANGPAMAVGGPCKFDDPDDGQELRCIELPLEPGGHYAVGVTRVGPDCNGRCAFNRFALDLALATP